MDWTNIIITLITSGAFTAIYLLGDRKTAAVLDNVSKTIDQWQELLGEVKATGDIFFPASWCSAILGGHRCEAAYQEYSSFMARECRYIPLLKRKIQEAGYMLGRAHDKRK